MPNRKGRPLLPPSKDEKINEKRKYYREYNRRRRKDILALAEEFNKDEKVVNIYKEKHKKCTKKVAELSSNLKTKEKLLDKALKTNDEIIASYDKILKKKIQGKGSKK